MLKLLLGSCAIFLITGLINSEIVHFEGCPGDLFFFSLTQKYIFRESDTRKKRHCCFHLRFYYFNLHSGKSGC
jgi:hypothetical protein